MNFLGIIISPYRDWKFTNANDCKILVDELNERNFEIGKIKNLSIISIMKKGGRY